MPELIPVCKVMLLPISIIRSTNLQKREIRALYFIFAAGGLSVTANVVRLILVAKQHRLLEPTADFAELVEICTIVEVYTAFLAACLPALRALMFQDGIRALWDDDARRRRRMYEAERRSRNTASGSSGSRRRKGRMDVETGSTMELHSVPGQGS